MTFPTSPHRTKIELALTGHPGVTRAEVIGSAADNMDARSTVYIVADDAYLDRACSVESDEARLTEQWRKIYDLYQKPNSGGSVESGLSTQVWKSAYDGRPIADLEMREWIDRTLDRVRQLNPARVLEIGCGLGALLLPLAPNCERYVGTDISGASIDRLKHRVEASPEKLGSVQLCVRAADQLTDFKDATFDTVIINSVTMYFPTTEYLTKVLLNAVRVTRPNGAVYVGDIRSLPLLTTFAVSVELSRANAELSLDDLRGRVRRRLRRENELFISPTYFRALKNIHPEISRVEILPKRGQYDNEMNCFRYDAVLYLGSFPDRITPSWLDWSQDALTFEAIDRMLRRQRPEILAITNIVNSRIEKDVLAMKMLSDPRLASSAGALRDVLATAPKCGVHPERLFSLADEVGYHMDFSWASCQPEGGYDVVFRRRSDHQMLSAGIEWPQASPLSGVLPHHTKGPVQKSRRRKLVQELRDRLTAQFGEHWATAEFILLDAPTNLDGARPPPWLSDI